MQIREATISDLPILRDLTEQLGYPLAELDLRNNLEIILGNDNEIIYVMAENDKPIAWIHIFHTIRLESGSFCELGGLIVDKNYRSKGIGKLMIEKAIEWTKQRNVPVLKLRSNVIRKDAHRFYTNFGFREIKEQKVFEMKLK